MLNFQPDQPEKWILHNSLMEASDELKFHLGRPQYNMVTFFQPLAIWTYVYAIGNKTLKKTKWGSEIKKTQHFPSANYFTIL